MVPIELHFWPTPNGWKIAIMLEECELPNDLNWVDLSQKAQFKSSFLAVSPNGRMPAILDPDGPDNGAISIFESGAILQYLGNKTGRFIQSGNASAAMLNSGYFGRWRDWVPWPVRQRTSAITRLIKLTTPLNATPMKLSGCTML